MKKIIPLVIFILSLSGCVSFNGSVQSSKDDPFNEMVVIGVPLLLGGFGSAVPLNSEYMLTAAHVARLSFDTGVIYHPQCDLALIPRKSKTQPEWGLIYPQQAVTHKGYSLLGLPIEGQGKYFQDVYDTNTGCLYSMSDAPVMSGMSGGLVQNSKGEIVGVTVAIIHNAKELTNIKEADRYSQFVPAPVIFQWLESIGVDTSKATKELQNTLK